MRRLLMFTALLALGGALACGRSAPSAPPPTRAAERPISLDQPTAPRELAEYFFSHQHYDSCLLAIAAQPDTELARRFQARVLLAKRRGEAAEQLLRERRDQSDWQDLYLAALESAGDEAILRGDEGKARQFWEEWARRAPEDEAPHAMLIAIGVTPPAAGTSTTSPAPPRVTTSAISIPSHPVTTVPTAPRSTATTTVPASPAPPSLRDVRDLIRGGQYAQAENLCRQCLKREPGSPTAWNLLGISLKQQGKREQARAALVRSLELDPDQSEVRLAIEELR